MTNKRIYIYAAAMIAAIALTIMISNAWTDRKIAAIEKRAEQQSAAAEAADQRANEAEKKAASFEEKINYLEAQAAETERYRRTQNEDLKKISADTDAARRNVERVRRTRPNAANAPTVTDTCRELARAGYGCE